MKAPHDRAQEAIDRLDAVAHELGLRIEQTEASRKYRLGKSGPASWLHPRQDKMTFDLRTLRRAGREADAIRIHKALQTLSGQPVQLDMAAIPLGDLIAHWEAVRESVILPFFDVRPMPVSGIRPPASPAESDPPDVVRVKELLSRGESATLEFKSSARWDRDLKARNKLLEDAIVKTIVGFANSREGGILLIGVDDDGQVVGLSNDFKLQKRADADGYENWLTTLLSTRMGKAAASSVRTSMVVIGSDHVCMVRVDSSPDAVFDREGIQARFFVRMNNSTRELNAAEMHEYAKRRFT